MAETGIATSTADTASTQSPAGDSNAAAWCDPRSVRLYRKADGLAPAEIVILEHHGRELLGARLLDIGVGTGRTTPQLRDRCLAYVGIDYAAPMLERARERYPDADLQVADARDLSRFADGSFGAVVFSFNGIDYVPHDDRLRILAEVRRVLRAGGLFVFSTHNRDVAVPPAASLANLHFSRNPIRLAYNSYVYLAGIANARHTRRHERREAEYALINDPGLYFRLVTYYISRVAQAEQLTRAGFVSPRAFDTSGRELPIDGPPVGDFMIHYVTRRAGQ